MTEKQIEALGPALADFLDQFLFCCDYTQTFAHLGTYVRGLLSDLPRKTCEPVALAAGTPVRTLQEFLTDHGWDAAAVRDRLRGDAARLLPTLPDPDGLGTAGLIDETSARKRGDQTPGVGRQYLGCLGKVDNGLVTVHLGACRGAFQTLLDADLYLPESWDQDRARCRRAGLPDDVRYRPKWQIALGQVDRALAAGVRLDWLTFDAAYGRSPGFAAGLDARGLRFVGEVPCNLSCLAAHRAGRPPAAAVPARPAEEVARLGSAFLRQPWRLARLARQTTEDQVWRVKAAPVWLHGEAGWSAGTYWLLWASSDQTGEEKFFLSNAPPDSAVETLLRVGFRRASVEHAFRIAKGELGFTHFEGRSYAALLRHLSLCLVAVNFTAAHTQRLRGEKPGRDGGAGVPGVGPAEPALAGAAAGDRGGRVSAHGHHLPPGPQPRGAAVEEEAPGRRPGQEKAPAQEAETAKRMHSKVKVAL